MAAVGAITFEFRLSECHSLKDKRHIIRSLKDRLRTRFNVAVAEVDFQELWQRAALAVVTVGPDWQRVESILESVERDVEAQVGAALIKVEGERLL